MHLDIFLFQVLFFFNMLNIFGVKNFAVLKIVWLFIFMLIP